MMYNLFFLYSTILNPQLNLYERSVDTYTLCRKSPIQQVEDLNTRLDISFTKDGYLCEFLSERKLHLKCKDVDVKVSPGFGDTIYEYHIYSYAFLTYEDCRDLHKRYLLMTQPREKQQ